MSLHTKRRNENEKADHLANRRKKKESDAAPTTEGEKQRPWCEGESGEQGGNLLTQSVVFTQASASLVFRIEEEEIHTVRERTACLRNHSV